MNITTLMQQAEQDEELMQSMSQALMNGFGHSLPLASNMVMDSDALFEQRTQQQVLQASDILNGLNQVKNQICQQRHAAMQSPQAQNDASDIIEGEFVVDSDK